MRNPAVGAINRIISMVLFLYLDNFKTYKKTAQKEDIRSKKFMLRTMMAVYEHFKYTTCLKPLPETLEKPVDKSHIKKDFYLSPGHITF